MTTSGTVAQTTIRVVDILEDALKACGVPTVEMTPEVYKTAQNNLYFYLSALANDGIQLWTIQKFVIGLIPGQTKYNLDAGTVDVLNTVYRTVTSITNSSGGSSASSAGGSATNAFDGDVTTVCTQTSSNGNISYALPSGTTLSCIQFGILPNGSATYNLVYEYSDDGITWTAAYAPGSASYTDLVWSMAEIDYASDHQYWRVRESGGATLDVREVMFGAQPTDIEISRISNDVYADLPSKFQNGSQPLQYWVNRQVDRVSLQVWPPSNSCLNQLVVYRRRQVQDVGNLTNTLDIPQRWIFAIVSGLAKNLCLKVPGADLNRYTILTQLADEQWNRASAEERDNTPIDLMSGLLQNYNGSSW